MDGASCHTNEEFVRFCYSKNILPFRLPSHTTHLLQPLNIVYFQPLTHYHSLRNVIFILSKFGKVREAKILRPVNASEMTSWFRAHIYNGSSLINTPFDWYHNPQLLVPLHNPFPFTSPVLPSFFSILYDVPMQSL